jgi:uncharacterized membrane-anchored protein YjiN (DUF445 family)
MPPASPAPGLDTARGVADGDTVRRAALARTRRRATLLLVMVTIVFAATFFLGEATWVGFVRATAEAAMVGGVADWFAVVALFRHPLGIPIPHTAVIPRSKEGLGANLATFVSDNFLDPDQLAHRIDEADLAARAGAWLEEPANAEATAARVADLLVALVDDLDSDRMVAGVADLATRAVETLPTARLAGRGLAAAIAEGQHHAVLTAAIGGIRTAVVENADVLRRRLYRESPRWVPPALDDIVFDRAARGLVRFLDEVAADPGHPVRTIVDRRLQDLATSLQEDPATAEAVREQLRDLANNPAIHDWAAATWDEIATVVRSAAADPASTIRTDLAERLRHLGHQLQHDDRVRHGVDDWIGSVAPTIARESRSEIAELVAATVDRWDPEETSDRLELWLGRDLQFVRINGTVVGGLVGLVLHTVTVVAGG